VIWRRKKLKIMNGIFYALEIFYKDCKKFLKKDEK
jgi:hypothetical protein